MDRGIRGAVSAAGGVMLLGRSAALAVALLALAAIPLAAAETGPRPTQPPVVTQVEIAPNPVLPGPLTVTATAVSDGGFPVLGVRFFADSPFNATPAFMSPADGRFDNATEGAVWYGTHADFLPGWHTLYVHATEDSATWGPFATTVFLVEAPTSYGPRVASVSVTPELPLGAPLSIRADLVDPFGPPPWYSYVVNAEAFLDTFLGDGRGMPMTGTYYGDPALTASWSGLPVLPPGTHRAYVHGLNRYGTWGPLAEASFTMRAPFLSLSFVADRDSARRDEPVVYTVGFANTGNANATSVWIDVALPPALAYVADDASGSGGSKIGLTSYVFEDVPPGVRSFRIETRVPSDATDGVPLDARATLDYTNERAWEFPPVTASASGSVIAPEMAVTFSGSSQAFAGETVTSSVTLIHTGVRTIPSVLVALDASPWVEFVSDTASGIGGALVGVRTWRLTALDPGVYTFTVTERIRPEAVDSLPISRSLLVSYTSRLGDLALASASGTLTVARPAFTLRAAAQPQEVTVGDQITVSVEFSNVGSAPSHALQIRVPLGDGLALVGGDPPAGMSLGAHVWTQQDVPPGPRRLDILLGAREDGVFELTFSLLYTSPNGAPLGTREASFLVVVHPRPPPLLLTYAGFAATGALVAFAGFLATERGKTALLLLLVPLYTRLRHEKVLDHETRGMIRGYIVANPGDHYNSIKEALELPNGTLAYHIQVLVKESLVRSVKDGKFRRFYPYDMRVPEGGEPTRIQKHLLDLVRANPGLTPRDAAGLLGLTSSTVSYHLERLLELEKVEVRREGISKRLYVKGDLET